MDASDLPDGAQALTSWPVTPAPTLNNNTKTSKAESKAPLKRSKAEDHQDRTNANKRRFRSAEPCFKDARVATVAIVQWWRAECRAGTAMPDLVKKQVDGLRNPLSRVMYLAGTKEGRRVLEEARGRLEGYCRDVGWRSDETGCVLATYHCLLGEAASAVNVLERCRHLPAESELLLHRMRMQVAADKIRREREEAAAGSARSSLEIDTVDCICVDDMSYERFYNQYATKGKPVVIRGAGYNMVNVPWTMSFLKERIGNKSVDVRRRVEGSLSWAGLEDGGNVRVGDFIDKVVTSAGDGEMEYLFDWSIPLFAPELLDHVVMPKYFSGDWLQRTPAGSRYQDTWPSLFVGAAGTSSGLHVDTFHSNFYMAVFEGYKEWVFFQEEDTALLYPSYQISTDPAFPQGVLDSDKSNQFPAARLARQRKCVVGPGDLLFVPAGCPHTVKNLTNTVAVSGNFVDGSNIDGVREFLKISSIVDPMDKQLLNALTDPSLDTSIDMDQRDLPWRQFKRHAG